MKKCTYKPFSVILLFIVSTLLIGILAGCDRSEISVTTPEPEPAPIVPINEVFSDEMKAKIDEAYMEAYNKSLQFDQTGEYAVWYLGTYDDGIVFYKHFERTANSFISSVEGVEISDWLLWLSSDDNLCVYRDEKVKRVDEAYEDSQLSEENIRLIIKQYDKLMNRLYNWTNSVRPVELRSD